MKKTTLHFYKTGDFWRLEDKLNEMSRQGWQPEKPGRLLQRYTFDDSAAYVFRFGVSGHREGSADDITCIAAQAKTGWKPACRKGNWILFRKKADAAEENEQLPDGRGGIETLFAGRIKSCETFRMWMIVIASALMLAGYFTDILPLLYSFAIPLLAALFVTLRIKYMQEGIKH